jgi:hypothetical protein
VIMNQYVDYIYVIPEDDANRQIADGFVLNPRVNDLRIQVVPPAGGWSKVLKTFKDEYIPKLRNQTKTHVVMLIDFDDQVERRRTEFENEIPDEFKARVFVIGSKHTPETLKRSARRTFEEIGRSLADDCDTDTAALWCDEQLSHNETNRQRLVEMVMPFLFQRLNQT